MEQIVLLLDQIVFSQYFLKANFITLNEYWIKPHIGLQPDPNYISNPELELQITQSIELIDINLCQIIQIIKSNNIFSLILECTTLEKFQTLACMNFTGISFVFGIPDEFKSKIEELSNLDLNTLFGQITEFINEFKNMFGYKFLDLLTEEVTKQIILTFLHIKKLYLEYYKNPNET